MVLAFRRLHALRLLSACFAAVLVGAACSGPETEAGDSIDDVVEATDESLGGEQATAGDDAGEEQDLTPSEEDEVDVEQDPVDSLTSEEAAAQFSQCMRDQGLDFPDLELDATGNVDTGALLQSLNLGDPAVQAALTACQDLLGAGGLTDQLQETLASQELADSLIEFSECVRAEGFDVPDLTVSGVLGGVLASGQIGSDDSAGPDVNAILALALGLDPEDPAVQAAMATCFPIVAESAAGLGLAQ